MAKKVRVYSRTASDAITLLGLQVRQGRVERRWTAEELSERAGVDRKTLLKVESGDPTVAIGIALDIASLVGVPLFFADRSRLVAEINRSADRIALLPPSVRPRKGDGDDDF